MEIYYNIKKKNIVKILKSFIESNYIKILLSIGIVLQIHYFTSVPRLSSDNLEQLISTQNWLAGNGHSFEQASPNDYSKSIFRDNGDWPPGFSILAIPLLKLKLNPIQICNVIGSIGIIICMISLCWIYSTFSRKYAIKSGQSLFIIFISVSYSLFRSAGSTDIMSLGILLLSIAYFFSNFDLTLSNNKVSLKKILLLSLLTSLTAWFRYAYLPISFFLVIVFFFATLKNKFVWKQGFLHLIFHCLLIFPLFFLITFFDYPGSPEIINSSFFFSGLMDLDPVGFNSFFIYPLFTKIIIHFTGSYFILYFSTFIISFFVLVLIFYGVYRLLIYSFDNGILIILLPFIILLFMMAHRHIQASFAGFENRYLIQRYFILCHVIIILLSFVLAFSNIKYINVKFKNTLKFLIYFSLLINFIYFGYYKYKFKLFDYKSNLAQFYEPEGASFDYFSLKETLESHRSDNKMVFVKNRGPKDRRIKGQDNFLYRFASLAGCSILDKEVLVNNIIHKSKKPIDLFVPLPKDTNDVFLTTFCNENNARLYKELNSAKFNIMLVKLSPHSLKND